MSGDSNEEAELQAESARIETLLTELRELVPLPAWQRVEDVLRRIVRLYSAGLARALAHARRAGAAGPEFDAKLCNDDLLASLLVLHGLHPQTMEQRILHALAALRSELRLADDALVVTSIADGVVHLHATESIGGGAMSRGLAEGMIRRVLEAAAPEITSIVIAGLPRPHDPSLVQLRRSRSAP
jgi:hypothetical protein